MPCAHGEEPLLTTAQVAAPELSGWGVLPESDCPRAPELPLLRNDLALGLRKHLSEESDFCRISDFYLKQPSLHYLTGIFH